MPAAASKTLRAFVALELDAMSLRRVARVADRLRMGSGAPSATWTPSSKMHVTVKFLGQFERDSVEPFAAAVRRLTEGKAAPRPGAIHLDAFPSVEVAEVVVALLDDGAGEIAKLSARVEKVAAKFGAPPEKRTYRPHVTLARLKMPYDVRRWLRPELAPGTDSCHVAALTLFESRADAQGSTYLRLASFPYKTSTHTS
jgi:2'-5' RNA ligase